MYINCFVIELNEPRIIAVWAFVASYLCCNFSRNTRKWSLFILEASYKHLKSVLIPNQICNYESLEVYKMNYSRNQGTGFHFCQI